MKKSLMKKIALSVLASAALLSSHTAWASEHWTVTIDGAHVYAVNKNAPDWTVTIDGAHVYAVNKNEKGTLSKPLPDIPSYGKVYNYYGKFYDSSNVEGESITIDSSDTFSTCTIRGGASESGDASKNSVIIENGTFNDASSISGGRTTNGTASKNSVTINGGTFQGGNSQVSTSIFGGLSSNGTASDNTVTINGGTFNICFIYGGMASDNTTNNDKTTNNTVNISGRANLANAAVFGGAYGMFDASYGGQSTPNTLNIGNENTGWNPADSNGRTIAMIRGFDVINFNNLKWDTGEIALNTTDLGIGNDGLSVKINSLSKDSKPKVNDVMTLIHAGSDIDESKIKDVDTTTNIGSFVKAEGYLSVDEANDNINFTITKLGGNEQALVIGESRVAATAFTNQGSDLVESGIDALVRDNTKAGDSKFFASLYGNASEYATGSHVKVNGFSGILGFGRTTAHGLTAGAFFEAGEGNYRTYNNIDGDFMRGDGEASYSGGGLLVRKDNANGVYAEASVRAGNLKNELRNAVKGSDGLAGYDINTFYYGAHLGLGVVIPRGSDGDSFDIYSKFIYTHHDSENFKIDGDEFHFDSVESERLRLGFRYNNVFDKLTMYCSAVWEYEFGGDADNTVVGYDLNTPSLKGSTVIGEIGTHYKATDNWSFDLKGRAYVGQREGVSGSLQVNYRF